MTPGFSSMRSIRCPDRSHGYCVDDNARALTAGLRTQHAGEQRLPEALTARLAAFVQHAWNPDTRRFRNFMSFDRRWLEDSGSEDSHGRTLWALGECARSDCKPVAPALGRSLVRRGAAGCRGLSVAARLGFHASRPGRLLRRGPGGCPRAAAFSICSPTG